VIKEIDNLAHEEPFPNMLTICYVACLLEAGQSEVVTISRMKLASPALAISASDGGVTKQMETAAR
jgi:hypothetical protein